MESKQEEGESGSPSGSPSGPPKKDRKEIEAAKERAREGLEKRSRRGSDAIYYWMVIGGFIVMCIGCVVYVIVEWKESPNLVAAINPASIEKHNAQDRLFKRGPNSIFANLKLDDAKHFFQSFLSDDFKEVYFCSSREDKTQIIPESFDFREQYPECVNPVVSQGNCSGAYALALASMISDRLCLVTRKKVMISAQHVISCDKDINEGCKRGYSQRAYDFFVRQRIINESCLPYAGGKPVECEEKCNKTLEEHSKISRICGVESPESLKREIVMNGPVITKLEIFDDFLTYKSGIYSGDFHSYVYAGGQVVKVIGWGAENNVKYWLIENTWGEDWGENGYARVRMADRDDLHISQIAMGVVVEGKREEKKAKPEEGKAEEAKGEEAKGEEEKPVEEKPVEDKPVEEKPVEEKPVEEKPVEEKPKV